MCSSPCKTKTCKLCMSASNWTLQLRVCKSVQVWFQRQFWLGDTKHAVFQLLYWCSMGAPKNKVEYSTGGSAWCSSIIPSARISWGFRGCRAAELVPDLMSWCASLSQNRTTVKWIPLLDVARPSSSISNTVNRLYEFTILILTSQQLMVHNLPHHPSSEVGHVFLWIKEKSWATFRPLSWWWPVTVHLLCWCGLWLPVWMWLACLW